MKKILLGAFLLSASLFSGCSGAFWGGTATGAGGAGAAYEVRAKQQLDQIKRDLESGKIDQREFDIRKDQIQRGSVIY